MERVQVISQQNGDDFTERVASRVEATFRDPEEPRDGTLLPPPEASEANLPSPQTIIQILAEMRPYQVFELKKSSIEAEVKRTGAIRTDGPVSRYPPIPKPAGITVPLMSTIDWLSMPDGERDAAYKLYKYDPWKDDSNQDAERCPRCGYFVEYYSQAVEPYDREDTEEIRRLERCVMDNILHRIRR